MKVLYGITKSDFGGAQRYVFDLATEAQKSGLEVAVMCGGSGPLVQKLKDSGIRVIPLPELQRDISLIKDFKSFLFIVQTLKKEKPDVFHTNSSKMGGLGNLAGRIAGVRKIIFTGHAWAFNEDRNWLSKLFIWELTRHTITLSHKTICVSGKTKQDVSWMPFIKNKLVVINNGIKSFETKTREEARKIMSVDQNTLLIGSVSELHKIKGLDILINAWKKFIGNDKSKLFIFGEGEERGNLEELIQTLDFTQNVSLRGYIENARNLISAFDIFVLPSRSEAMPYALLEAGFAGLPVVASSVGGIPEVIGNNVNGILVEKENVEELASALTRLFENPSFREKLGTNLKETISTKFSFENMIQKTFAIYKNLRI